MDCKESEALRWKSEIEVREWVCRSLKTRRLDNDRQESGGKLVYAKMPKMIDSYSESGSDAGQHSGSSHANQSICCAGNMARCEGRTNPVSLTKVPRALGYWVRSVPEPFIPIASGVFWTSSTETYVNAEFKMVDVSIRERCPRTLATSQLHTNHLLRTCTQFQIVLELDSRLNLSVTLLLLAQQEIGSFT